MPLAFDLDSWAGGPIHAQDFQELIEVAQQEYSAWDTFIAKFTQEHLGSSGTLDIISVTKESWKILKAELEMNVGASMMQLTPENHALLAYSSPGGTELRSAALLNDVDRAASIIDRARLVTEIRQIPAVDEKLRRDIALEEAINRAIRNQFPNIDMLVGNMSSLEAEMRSTLDGAHSSLISSLDRLQAAQYEWNALLVSYREKLDLEKSSQLWSNRASIHRNSAHKLAIISIIAGLISFVLPVVAATLLFYNSAILMGSLADPLHQLIFASAGTLLALTLCLWGARIVIRLYMTERHLATDADARAALGETYVSLLSESGAMSEDRHIVLAALFRPVRDGIVHDDGMPLVTPGAIAASLLSGSGKG